MPVRWMLVIAVGNLVASVMSNLFLKALTRLGGADPAD